MAHSGLVYSTDTGGNIDEKLFVANCFDVSAGVYFDRDNWDSMPNAEKGDERHSVYNFLRVAWAGQNIVGAVTATHTWEQDDDVTAEWFVAHQSVVTAALDGHGSFTYTNVDMEARVAVARVVPSTTRTRWIDYPYKYAPDIDYLKVEMDAGASLLCTIAIADNWESWVSEERDVIAEMTETIESPAIGKPVYITFSADCEVNGNAVGRGDTLKLTSSSFNITTAANTKLIANYSLGE